MAPRVSYASLPRLKSPELSLQVGSGPTLQSSSWSLEGHPHLTFAQSPTVLRSLRVSSPLLPLPQLTNAHHLLASVWPPLDTWLSSPRRTTMKKKQQAQRGEKGSITTARGYAMKARPGPTAGSRGTRLSVWASSGAHVIPVCCQGIMGARGNFTSKLLSPPLSSPRRNHSNLYLVPKLPSHHCCILICRNRT